MFDENSLIHCYFYITPEYFKTFIDNYFDQNGKCLINGVFLSKEDALKKIKEIESENLQKAKDLSERTERWNMNVIEDGIRQGLTREEAENNLARHPYTSIGHEPLSLAVHMGLETLKCSDEFIKYFIQNGSSTYEETNQLGIDKIIFDEIHYELDSGVRYAKKFGNLFYSEEEEVEKREKIDEIKREKLISDFLKYKRKFTPGSERQTGNTNFDEQLSETRHI